MEKRIIKVMLRFLGIFLWILGMFPLYFWLRAPFISTYGHDDYRQVEIIDERTYEELQETDEMYGHLPYGAKIKEVWVKQQLGDAYVDVILEVEEELADAFEQWLEEEGHVINREENLFSFGYLIPDGHHDFGAFVENHNSSWFDKIYWTAAVCILIGLLLPYETLFGKRKEEET